MLETIGVNLISAIVVFMFEHNILTHQETHISIQEAPQWYMKPQKEECFYVYSYAEGGTASVDTARTKLENRMEAQVESGLQEALYLVNPEKPILHTPFVLLHHKHLIAPERHLSTF